MYNYLFQKDLDLPFTVLIHCDLLLVSYFKSIIQDDLNFGLTTLNSASPRDYELLFFMIFKNGS